MSSDRRWQRALFSGLGIFAFALTAAVRPALAQEADTVAPRWDHTLIVRASYADYEAGPGTGQSVMLYRARPGHRWIMSVGHSILFGAEGYGVGVNYQRSWDRFRIGGGISSGANVHGALYPRYHVSLTAGTDLAPGVPLWVSVSRRRAARTDAYTDWIRIGARWWAPGPWLFSAHTAYAMGHPGNTDGWSGGVGVTYMLWRRLHMGVKANYGDGSYLLWPSQGVIEYRTWSYGGSVTKYLTPEVGLSLSVDYTDYYDGVSFRLGVSRQW